MNVPDKNVVMACTHPYWSVLQVGSQHLARQFARHGWQVHYFSAPITPVHLLKLSAPEVLDRFKSARHNPSIHENGKISAYSPFSLIAPDGRILLRSQAVTDNWYKTMLPSFRRMLARFVSNHKAMIYIDNLSYHFLLNMLPNVKTVFRVMDMHERFPGWNGEALKLAQKIARKANLTVYSADGLKNYVDHLGADKTMYLPNGVDSEFFHTHHFSDRKHPLLLAIPDPIILYTGMIDNRLDFSFIKSVAARLPDVSFVFTGVLENMNALRGMASNVYYTGPVSHDELPWLMKSAKAGMIPFDVKNRMDHLKGIRPLKLLEFFAAGIPVICARWPEVENMKSPAWLYSDEKEFVAYVEKITNDNSYNAHKELNFAIENDWAKIFKKLLMATQ